MSTDDQSLKILREAVSEALGPIPNFDKVWDKIEQDYKSWLVKMSKLAEGPYKSWIKASEWHYETSNLNRNLDLLNRVCDAFHANHLRENKKIAELVMEGALKPGDVVVIHGVSYTILSRKLTNLGILYEQVNENGEITYHEFID